MKHLCIDRRSLVLGGLAAAAAAAAPGSWAAGYPQRIVKILVTTPAGAGPDAFARMFAERLSDKLGVQVIVENRPSGNGFIAALAAKSASADGYTVLMGVAQQFTINPVIYEKLPYDPVADFVPLLINAEYDTVLTVHPSVPASNVSELVKWIKANPGKLSYASFGNNTPSHFSGEAFKRQAGLDLTHVPYSGSPQQITDLVGGAVKMGFTVWAASRPFVEAGKLRILASTAKTRRPQLPDVPTMQEAGYPDVVAVGWYGFFLKRGAPADAIERLLREFTAISAEPAIRKRYQELGVDPMLIPGDQVPRYLEEETLHWRKTARAVGLKVE